jgi:hypothetical protein
VWVAMRSPWALRNWDVQQSELPTLYLTLVRDKAITQQGRKVPTAGSRLRAGGIKG